MGAELQINSRNYEKRAENAAKNTGEKYGKIRKNTDKREHYNIICGLNINLWDNCIGTYHCNQKFGLRLY